MRLLFSLIWFLGVGALFGAMPDVEFRAFQGKATTVEALVKMIESGKRDAEDISGKMDNLVNKSKLKLKILTPGNVKNGEEHRYEKVRGKIGSTLKMTPNYTKGKRALLIEMMYRSSAKRGKASQWDMEFSGSYVVERDGWGVVSFWASGEEMHALFVRINFPKGIKKGMISSHVKTRAQLLKVSQEVIGRFKKATPATRQKAIKWILGKGVVLKDTVLLVPAGQKVVYKDQSDHVWSLSVDAAMAANGKDFDLRVEGSWAELNFEVEEEIQGNRAVVIMPTEKSEAGAESVILVISPRVLSAEGGKK